MEGSARSKELATAVSTERTPGVASDARSPILMVPRVGRFALRPWQKMMATRAVDLLSIVSSPPPLAHVSNVC